MELVSSNEAAIIAFFFSVIFTCGSFSNGLIIWTYVRYKNILTIQPRDILILSLAIGDFVQVVFACPLGLTSAIARKWMWGDFGCSWYGFITTWVSLSSIIQLATFAMERYVTLRSPMANLITNWRAVQLTIVCWLITFLVSSFPLFGWSTYIKEGLGLHCSINWEEKSTGNLTFSLFLLIMFFLAPISVILIANLQLYIIVHHMYANASDMWGPEARATKQSYVAQVRTAKQLFAMIVAFLVSWTPYAFMSCYILIFEGTNISLGNREYPSIFAKTSVLLNPITYYFMYKALRQKAKSVLMCRTTNSVAQISSSQM